MKERFNMSWSSIVLLASWWTILFFSGMGINHVAKLSNMDMVINGTATVVTVLQVIGVIISLIIFLIYLWSCKKSKQLETYMRKKKREIRKATNEAKVNLNSSLENTKSNLNAAKQSINDSINKSKADVKRWYDKQWWAIEDDK